MKCKKCGGKFFHSVYEKGIKTGWQCDNCRTVQPIEYKQPYKGKQLKREE